MISLLSPAKSLDFTPIECLQTSQTRYQEETLTLVNRLQQCNVDDVKKMMNISEKLAQLNVNRYQNFSEYYTQENSKAAVYAFQGDVYIGWDAKTLEEDDMLFSQNHIRILSGLYGLLRPLDRIQQYRLEMGTKIKVGNCNNLYEFWNDKICKLLLDDMSAVNADTIINLASNEYFKSVKPYLNPLLKDRKLKLVDVKFLDQKNETFKIISFYAKKARGMMTRFIVKNKINKVKDLQAFDMDGYFIDIKASSDTSLVFKRLHR